MIFLGEEFAANTVDARITGFYEALRTHAVKPEWEPVWRGSPQDESFIRHMLNAAQPDAVVCANDLTAARLMQVLLAFGVRIPEDIKIVGMDDVRYASLLPSSPSPPSIRIVQESARLQWPPCVSASNIPSYPSAIYWSRSA